MQLRIFREKHGHCNVLRSYEDSYLACKVSSIRIQYHQNKLSKKQIGELKKLGFIFKPRDDRWQEFIKHLGKFKNKYGHCNAPREYKEGGMSLGHTVSYLRVKYRSGRLSKTTIAELKKIGFNFKPSKGPRT